jgi:FixJ family two-component response regulator
MLTWRMTVVTRVTPKIVIVDDDASVCRAIKRLIRSVNMDAELFTSGENYLQSARNRPLFHADCLILDLQMPGMSGLELQARLAGTGLPIIFITAHDELGARTQALAGGAVAFLRKPFDDELLITTIHAVLSQKDPTLAETPDSGSP